MSLDNFLRSLETDGGKLLVTVSMILFLTVIVLVLLISGHPPQEAGKEMLVGVFSSLFTILYGYLKSAGPSPK